MASKNGYFQILIDNNSTMITLYPPEDGGEKIRVDELRDYLLARGLKVDVLTLAKMIDSLMQPCNLLLCEKKIAPCMESMAVNISEDKMTATVRFFPASSFGISYIKESLIEDLHINGVKAGILENVVEEYLADRHYCTDYVIAMGTPATLGKDAVIDYKFNTNPSMKPKLNQDGSVDFFSLSAISAVKEGDVVAVLTPAVLGTPGLDVRGVEVLPPKVKEATLMGGNNLQISEDGLTMVALISGNASLANGKVFVQNAYEVSNVDASTGNIEYSGDVVVLGSVRSGYSIKTDGNIEIRGSVENASVTAGGNITINRGMNGMGQGFIKAGGNIVSKFLENALCVAEGSIYAEAILHCEVSAKGEISVDGKKGFITGGVVRCRGTVSAKSIGSTMGVETRIEVGTDPTLVMRANNLKQEIMEKQKQLATLTPTVQAIAQKVSAGAKLSYDQVAYLQKLKKQYDELREDVEIATEELMMFEDKVDEESSNDSCIKVSEFAYPGAVITVNGVSMTLKKDVQHALLVRDGAEIRVKGL